jgi:hypothetical protein
MGKTYQKNPKRFDDEQTSGRSGKHVKHSKNFKGEGMRTLNSYVEDDDYYDDPYHDDIGITDTIFIQHIKNDTNDTP